MPERRSLSIFHLRSGITAFDDAISVEVLPELATHDLVGDFDFDGRLYVEAPQPKDPAWVEFLHEGFGDAVEVSETANNRAVIVVRFAYFGADRYFALAFGGGRHLLRRDSYTRSYGLKAGLNMIYEDDDPTALAAPARVRRVDARTVGANTMRASRQANRHATFETFGLDVRRDLLGAVTGAPSDTGKWGTRVAGSDAIHLNMEVDFADIGKICKQIWRVQRSDDYLARFEWIDNILVVEDQSLMATLQAAVVDAVQMGAHADLALTPPELVDWDEIQAFGSSVRSDLTWPDLELANYIDLLNAEDKLDGLTVERLRRQKIRSMDSAGEVIHEWPVFRCLAGQIDLDGTTYLLDEGSFFEIAHGYLNELNLYIEGLPESTVGLPESPLKADGSEQIEGDYNEAAANASADHLLLDKKTVKVATHTSPIEICDVLTVDRRFIHVKRKLSSSRLSHLFSQGYVSGDLFLGSKEYRDATRAMIAQAEAERAADTGDATFNGKFQSSLNFDAPDSSQIEVVYAIVAKWGQRTLVDALPFFSKVNLRRHADDLTRMGYKVSYKRVPVSGP